ncbi:transposase [Candidatus Roizmanbacteria bacterium]|nr:MAG: transposase [Candidatus Roizmanbacteria bacterium]
MSKWGGDQLRVIRSYDWQYNRDLMKKIRSLSDYNQSDVAQIRNDVLTFAEKYGIQAAVDAYGISRRTLFRWRKRRRDSEGQLDSLIPETTKPKTPRRMETHPKVISFIKEIREQYFCLGKEKIKPLLDEYCLQEGISTISESTIGKVIKRHNLQRKTYRIYHNPASGFAKRKVKYRQKVKRSPKVEDTGYIEIDTITKFVHGIKLYVFNAVDIKLKFQFSYGYSKLNSRNGADFMRRLELVYPIQDGIKTIQTDNGLEYLGNFHDYLEENNIPHLFIYPRCPKINAFIERANRTLQEEFMNPYIYTKWTGIGSFNRHLIEYLVWYNTKRVHKSLNNISPMDYLLSILPKECHMYGTHTTYLQIL